MLMLMRARLVLLLSAALTLVLLVLVAASFWPATGDRASAFTVSVADLEVGSAKAIRVTLPGPRRRVERVFLTRTATKDVHAFLARSTHLGCRLWLPRDPNFGSGFTSTSPQHLIEDPCGGSTWTLNGECTAGPCPRALDWYAVTLRSDDVQIDLDHLHRGVHR
jgi:nitrite reductase/ring-hydroxylating ferredoxin subunit